MKVDLRRELDSYAARVGEVRFLQVPRRAYLAVDGAGDPNTAPAYAAALGALYPVAYALKAVGRAEHGRDHVVPPLEALWRADDPALFTTRRDKETWRWTVLLLVPDWLGEADVEAALTRTAARREPPEALDRVRYAHLDEGPCVQTLHVGPYDEEGPVIERLHAAAVAAGRALTGDHHEIYLGDPRRTAPERLRTILRQPVTR